MAETFLSEGAQVAICDVDEAALADFSAAHPDAIAIRASVAKPQQVESFLTRSKQLSAALKWYAPMPGPAALPLPSGRWSV